VLQRKKKETNHAEHFVNPVKTPTESIWIINVIRYQIKFCRVQPSTEQKCRAAHKLRGNSVFNGSKPQLNSVENRLFGFKNDKKRPINMVMVDQSYFIFTWKSLIPLWSKCDSHQGSEWSTLGAAIQEKALPRRRNRQHFGHCSIFFPKSPGP